MQQISTFRLVTGKHATSSGQLLGSLMPEYPDTRESETITVDSLDNYGHHVHVLDRKRKRGVLMEDELNVFTNMNYAIKEDTCAIRESKSVDVHADLYSTILDQGGFNS
ncbi:Histone-lysine N-methyltransferase SUVR5 [Hordeum vulgare]|nr:Histone-lysine N-methyltransferase SUVR5 [Hordeum vulgare]